MKDSIQKFIFIFMPVKLFHGMKKKRRLNETGL